MKLRLAVSSLTVAVLVLLRIPAASAQGQPAPPVPPAAAPTFAPPVPAVPAVPPAPAPPAVPADPAVPAAPASPTFPGQSHRHYSGISTDHDGPVADCSGLHIRLNDEETTVQSEEQTIPKAQAPVLRFEEGTNGGVQLQGWDKDAFSVTACKAVAASGSEAQQLLSQIRFSVLNGEISVSGPSNHDDWTVFLLIRTPKAATLDLSAHNGPMSFYGVDGKITARTTNGPISLKDCTGEADISAQNGPISYSGAGGGKLRIHTQNGPITVSLNAGNWSGSELVADAVNGPVTLRVPSNFQASFVVESDGHSPMSCQASICSDARKTWDDEHKRIEFGSGPANIRLSTVNGPVSVRSLREEM